MQIHTVIGQLVWHQLLLLLPRAPFIKSTFKDITDSMTDLGLASLHNYTTILHSKATQCVTRLLGY